MPFNPFSKKTPEVSHVEDLGDSGKRIHYVDGTSTLIVSEKKQRSSKNNHSLTSYSANSRRFADTKKKGWWKK